MENNNHVTDIKKIREMLKTINSEMPNYHSSDNKSGYLDNKRYLIHVGTSEIIGIGMLAIAFLYSLIAVVWVISTH